MAYLPPNVRYNPALTADAKILYAELTAMVGKNMRLKIDYAHLRTSFTLSTVEIRTSLNSLYKAGVIGKDGDFIALNPMGHGVEDEKMLKDVDVAFINTVLEHWNNLIKKDNPRGMRKTATLTKYVTQRQVTFTKDEILAALKNRHDYVNSNDWHNKPENKHHKLNALLVLESDDKLQECLSMGDNRVVDLRKQTVAIKKEKSDKSLLE
jgi:hypothetical protein